MILKMDKKDGQIQRRMKRDRQRITRVRGWLNGTTVGDHCRAADFLIAITTSVDTSLRLALDVALYIVDRNEMR